MSEQEFRNRGSTSETESLESDSDEHNKKPIIPAEQMKLVKALSVQTDLKRRTNVAARTHTGPRKSITLKKINENVQKIHNFAWHTQLALLL